MTTPRVTVPVEDLLFYKLKDLILEQSEGEWTDEMIVRDAHHFANHIRPLLSASPAPEGGAVRRVHIARASGTIDQQLAAVRQSETYKRGDTVLCWVNEGDLYANPSVVFEDLTALATREEASAEAGERDYPAEFEAWWATYRHRNRDVADYPVKKQIAFDAFYHAALRAQPQAREDAQPVALSLDGAPRDGTMLRLRVRYEAANQDEAWTPLEDSEESWTIGFNNFDNTGDDRWQFVGWDWSQDYLLEATGGAVIGWLPFHAHPAPDALRGAVSDIAAERQRQIDVEGWSEGHDDERDDYQMARAAGCYAFHAGRVDDDDAGMFVNAAVRHGWPWDRAWWRPKSRRADLVRSGALIVAEIERLDRAALQAEQKGGA